LTILIQYGGCCLHPLQPKIKNIGAGMAIQKYIFLLLAVFLYVEQVSASTDKTITWYKPEFPALSIVNGSDVGKGYLDQIENYLTQEIDGFDH
jgi:hypothetical protein